VRQRARAATGAALLGGRHLLSHQRLLLQVWPQRQHLLPWQQALRKRRTNILF